jgi:hypothetical protein
MGLRKAASAAAPGARGASETFVGPARSTESVNWSVPLSLWARATARTDGERGGLGDVDRAGDADWTGGVTRPVATVALPEENNCLSAATPRPIRPISPRDNVSPRNVRRSLRPPGPGALLIARQNDSWQATVQPAYDGSQCSRYDAHVRGIGRSPPLLEVNQPFHS